jgi:hypothetical protein
LASSQSVAPVTAKVGCKIALIVGFCSSSGSLAADEKEPIRLTYAADARCPSARDFEASVLERSSRARPARAREIAREYRVVVRVAQRRSVARLEFAELGGGTVVREVSAGECAEAVRAIAIVTALAFDAVVAAGSNSGKSTGQAPADAQARAEPPGATSAAAAPLSPATEPDTSATPADGESQTRPPPAPKPGANPEAPPIAAGRPEARDPARDETAFAVDTASAKRPELAFGARGTLTSAKAPSVLPGAELFALVADRRLRWLIQLGIAGERGARFQAGPGEARFSFVGGRLEGCFFGIPLDERISFMPCAAFEAGAVVVEGFIDEPRNVVDPWFAVGLNGRLAWRLDFATALLEAGPFLPLRPEDRVIFDDTPPTTVHDVPPVGGFVSLGLAWRAP